MGVEYTCAVVLRMPQGHSATCFRDEESLDRYLESERAKGVTIVDTYRNCDPKELPKILGESIQRSRRDRRQSLAVEEPSESLR